MGWITIDVELDDFLSSCSKYDRLELIEALIDDGHLPSDLVKLDGKYVLKSSVLASDDFNIVLQKLWNKGWQLTKEEEDTIRKISSRF